MNLSSYIYQFFDMYFCRIKGSSGRTIEAYQETFKLFLPFTAEYYSIKISSLSVDHLSTNLIVDFLDFLESKRGNTPNTRNLRLASLKSFAKMIQLMYPEKRIIAERILSIPKKQTQKKLIGFLYQEEVFKVFKKVDLKKNQGFRNYTLLHLLYNSGARASEIATLNLDYFNPQQKTLIIVGKGNRFRQIELWPKTASLIKLYIMKYRPIPKPLYQQRLFINKHRKELTRKGINRICHKYLSLALTPARLKTLNPVHSFRHSCAVNMLLSGFSVYEIRNHLGHIHINSTMRYLHLNLTRKKQIQKQIDEYIQSPFSQDPKYEKLIDWENREKTLAWLDSL